MQFIIEIHFRNGNYSRICNGIRDLCQEIKDADNSGIEIHLIRAYKYQPTVTVQEPKPSDNIDCHLQRI